MSHRRWAYFAKLVPIGVPVHVLTVKGTPARTTFDESTFEAERRNPGRIPVWVNHDRTVDVGRLERVYPDDGWWRVAFHGPLPDDADLVEADRAPVPLP